MGWGGWLVLGGVFTLLFGCGLSGVLCDVSRLTHALGGGGLGCFTVQVLPMPWKEQVGLYYSLGLPHFFLEHRFNLSAEDKNVRTDRPVVTRGQPHLFCGGGSLVKPTVTNLNTVMPPPQFAPKDWSP